MEKSVSGKCWRGIEGGEYTKAVCRLVACKRLRRYLTLDANDFPGIDQSKVKRKALLDGKYLLRTSDDTLPPEDIALGYKQLLRVDLRPMYHRAPIGSRLMFSSVG